MVVNSYLKRSKVVVCHLEIMLTDFGKGISLKEIMFDFTVFKRFYSNVCFYGVSRLIMNNIHNKLSCLKSIVI